MKKIYLILIFTILLHASQINFTFPNFNKCVGVVAKNITYIHNIPFYRYDANYIVATTSKKLKECNYYDNFSNVCLVKLKDKFRKRECKDIKLGTFLASISKNKI